MKKRSKKSNKQRIEPLTADEMVRLEQFLEATEGALPMVQAHGLISAMASTPSPSLGPSAWMGKVHGDHEFASPEEAQEITLLITRLYNQIVDDLNKGYFSGPQDAADARLWALGYMTGVKLDDKWQDSEEGVMMTMPVGLLTDELGDSEADAASMESLLEELPNKVLEIHQYWNDWRKQTLMPTISQARVPPPEKKVKVGRNEKCPCGSGKKYKKCCG